MNTNYFFPIMYFFLTFCIKNNAISRKVAGSIPNEVIGFTTAFQVHYTDMLILILSSYMTRNPR
jgi:hypothetical protein